MSDNLPPEVVQGELEAKLRIPTEVWTDVFKLLPRSVLIKQIAPVCHYFKEISDKNVKNVHIIEKAANLFTDKLITDDPEAKQQLEQLAGSNSGQFKLTNVQINEKSQFEAILRHCPDLFNGCKITLFIREQNKDSTLFLECLDHLEKAKPVVINVIDYVEDTIDYWHHPTFLNCTRTHLTFWTDPSSTETMKNVFDWLHHQPNGVDCCGGSADQQVRCMIFSEIYHNDINELINRCSEDIQQGRELANRRPYVLSFNCHVSDWTGFDRFHQIENTSTGEVLMLERVMKANGKPSGQYLFRRCLAEEVADGKKFYAGTFKDEECDEFKTDEKTPEVMIDWLTT